MVTRRMLRPLLLPILLGLLPPLLGAPAPQSYGEWLRALDDAIVVEDRAEVKAAIEALAAQAPPATGREAAGALLLEALPYCLEGEMTGTALATFGRLELPDSGPRLRRALQATLVGIDQAGPFAASYPDLIGQGAAIARELAKVREKAALPELRKLWPLERDKLKTALALTAIAEMADASCEELLIEELGNAGAERRCQALLGLCRLGSSAAPRVMHQWLATGIRKNQAEPIEQVRAGLALWPAAGIPALAAPVQEQLTALRPRSELDKDSRARQLATLEVAVVLGVRGLTESIPGAEALLAAVGARGNVGNGGALHAATARRLLARAGRLELTGWQGHAAASPAPGAWDFGREFVGEHGEDCRLVVDGADLLAGWQREFGVRPKLVERDLSAVDWAKRVVPPDEVQIDPRTGRLRVSPGESGEVQLLGSTVPGHDLFFAWPDQVEIRGNYGYMTCGENWDCGFAIVDISNPEAPRLAFTTYIGSFARGLQLNGDYAYVGNASAGFSTVVQVRDEAAGKPMAGRWVRRFNGGTNLGLDPQAKLLLATQGSSLKFLSLADPAKPKLVATLAMGAAVNDVRAAGDVAAVACKGALKLVTYADPRQPAVVGSLPIANAYSLALADKRAYVTDNTTGSIHIIDLADPAKPVQLGKVEGLNKNGIRCDLEQRDGRLLLYASEYGGGGIRIFDVTAPAKPRLVGRWRNRSLWEKLPGRGGNIADVAVANGRAVVSNFCFGMHVLDVTDPAAPRLAGEVRAAGEAGNLVALDENTVAVEDFCQGLLLFDCTDPAKMQAVGQYPNGGRSWPGVGWRDPVFYFSTQFPPGIVAVDCTDRRRPRPTAFLKTGIGVGASRMLGVGDWLFAAHRFGYSIMVLDLAEPRQPRRVAYLRGTSAFPDFAAAEQLLIVAEGSDREAGPLALFDIADPPAIRLVTRFAVPGGIRHVTAAGQIVWASGPEGLFALDVGNPFAVRLLAHLPHRLKQIKAAGGLLYAIQGKGVSAYRLPRWPPTSPEWGKLEALESLGRIPKLHPRWLCGMDVKASRLYAVAYNRLYAVRVPWSRLPPAPPELLLPTKD